MEDSPSSEDEESTTLSRSEADVKAQEEEDEITTEHLLRKSNRIEFAQVQDKGRRSGGID